MESNPNKFLLTRNFEYLVEQSPKFKYFFKPPIGTTSTTGQKL